ncbi:hypothetical protein F5146DRAFT_1125861 [Armillaria mellea]|nr:hypothetical protein F5146DRAFT_1125861 [Armillaria mellea]
MQLLDLPYELLAYIVYFSDPDTLRALCLAEKHVIQPIACSFLWRDVTVIFDIDKDARPTLLSLDSQRLAAVISLSINFPQSFDVHSPSFAPIVAQMVNVNLVRVSGGSGPFVPMVLENTKVSLVTLELDRCDADPQDFADMVPITLRELRPLTVEDLEVHGPGFDRECMPIGVTLRRLTDAHLSKMRRLCLVHTCRDSGCRDILHLTRVMDVRTLP